MTCSLAVAQLWSVYDLMEANTAANCDYLSQVEKDVILYNNLARLFPQKFLDIELSNASDNGYVTSLKQTLANMEPCAALLPNEVMTSYARCWAVESGNSGITGHNRQKCPHYSEAYPGGYYCGENCSYGKKAGKDIILQLLIDKDVPSLGHRENCLNPDYKSVGVACADHARYSTCCVMDFAGHEGDICSSEKAPGAEQSRAEQNRAEQSRTEQSRAEQSRAEQSRAEQSRAEQSRAEQNTSTPPCFESIA